MKNKIIVIIALAFIAQFTKALEPQKLIEQGNNLYKKGLFSQAASQYQVLVDSGYSSYELYYNLGNAYFKAKNTKAAILNYEKAKLLNPRDKDLDYNLSLVRSNLIDKIEIIPDIFFIEWIKSIRNIFSVNSWSFLSIGFFILSLGLFLWYFFASEINMKKTAFYIGLSLLGFALVSGLFAYSEDRLLDNEKTAIIYVPAVTVKSTPAESGTSLFILHEGTKVQIIDKIDNWHKIKIPDGNQGWVKISDLAKI